MYLFLAQVSFLDALVCQQLRAGAAALYVEVQYAMAEIGDGRHRVGRGDALHFRVRRHDPHVVVDEIQRRIDRLIPTFPEGIVDAWRTTMATKVQECPVDGLPVADDSQ